MMSNRNSPLVDNDNPIALIFDLLNVSSNANNTNTTAIELLADINHTDTINSYNQLGIIQTIDTDTRHTMNPVYGVILLILMISLFCIRRINELIDNQKRSTNKSLLHNHDNNDDTQQLLGIQTINTQSPSSPYQPYALASMLFGIDIQHSPHRGYTVVDKNDTIPHNDDIAIENDVKQRRKPVTSDIELSSVQSALHHTPLIMDTRTHILNKYLLEQLLSVLPAQQKLRDLQLVYNTSIHGYSLTELYRLSPITTSYSAINGYLTIIEDSDHYIFGCYTSDAWTHKPYYYGNAYCFVFSLVPEFKCYRSLQLTDSSSGNSYYQLAKSDQLAIGGGNHFSIWLDQYVRAGQSLPCDTFSSPVLSKQSHFTCINMEVWAFV